MSGRSNNSTPYLYFLLPHESGGGKSMVQGFKILSVRPQVTNLHRLLWTILSFGRYRRYSLLVDGEEVSTAEVMPYMPIFRFMKPGGIHIGPCVTKKQHRGHGYYPLLISQIACEYQDRQSYIFCHETNSASIRGIEKAGGQLFARGRKTRMGFYVISTHILTKQQ